MADAPPYFNAVVNSFRQIRQNESGLHPETDNCCWRPIATQGCFPRHVADARGSLSRNLIVLAIIATTTANGCSGLRNRCPKASKSIAAREQGQLGLQFLHGGKLKEAEARFSHALEACPEDVRLRHDLAVVRQQQGRIPEAIAEMQKAVESSGGEPAWLAEMATMQLAQGDLVGAWQSADRAVQRQPSLAAAWHVRGDILKQSGRLEDALRDYHRAIAENENSPEILMQVSDTYRLLGRPRRALSTLQRLTDSIPSEEHPPNLAYSRALAFQALSRHPEALTHFAEARSRQGEDPEILIQSAISQWAVGDAAGARSTLELASNANPQNPRIVALLVRWQSEQQSAPRVAQAE